MKAVHRLFVSSLVHIHDFIMMLLNEKCAIILILCSNNRIHDIMNMIITIAFSNTGLTERNGKFIVYILIILK